MPRTIADIITHIRMVSDNPNVSSTLIQTEDLLLLCDAAEAAQHTPGACEWCGNPRPGQHHICPIRI